MRTSSSALGARLSFLRIRLGRVIRDIRRKHAPAVFDEREAESLPGGSRASARWRFQAAASALGNLVFGQCCQKTPGRPAFLVGLGSKRGPDLFDGRQPQLSKEQLGASGIAGTGGSYAASTSWTMLSSS